MLVVGVFRFCCLLRLLWLAGFGYCVSVNSVGIVIYMV